MFGFRKTIAKKECTTRSGLCKQKNAPIIAPNPVSRRVPFSRVIIDFANELTLAKDSSPDHRTDKADR